MSIYQRTLLLAALVGAAQARNLNIVDSTSQSNSITHDAIPIKVYDADNNPIDKGTVYIVSDWEKRGDGVDAEFIYKY